jgi:FMN phosphatase YigB (HAD superfamily)
MHPRLFGCPGLQTTGGMLVPLFTSAVAGAAGLAETTGKEKPNPAAFECVFADFPLARRGWMIGDSWSADVGGASGVGMRSILVRNRHQESGFACDALEDVIALPDRGEQPP